MRFFKVVTYTTGEEFETHEFYVDEPTFRIYQKAIAEGRDFIVAEDRVIKRKMIKEIIPADKDIAEYKKVGVTHKQLGLPERPLLEQNKEPKKEGFLGIGKRINEKKEL